MINVANRMYILDENNHFCRQFASGEYSSDSGALIELIH